MRSNPGSGRSCGGGNGNPLQYSCLENSMKRGAWRATVHGLIKSRTQHDSACIHLNWNCSLHFPWIHTHSGHQSSIWQLSFLCETLCSRFPRHFRFSFYLWLFLSRFTFSSTLFWMWCHTFRTWHPWPVTSITSLTPPLTSHSVCPDWAATMAATSTPVLLIMCPHFSDTACSPPS